MKLNNHVQIRPFLLGLTSRASHSSATHTHTHTLTCCLKVDDDKKRRRTAVLPLYKTVSPRIILLIWARTGSKIMCTYTGRTSRLSQRDGLLNPAHSEVLVLVMWLTRRGATSVWLQHNQKVLWSLSKHPTKLAMPSCKTTDQHLCFHSFFLNGQELVSRYIMVWKSHRVNVLSSLCSCSFFYFNWEDTDRTCHCKLSVSCMTAQRRKFPTTFSSLKKRQYCLFQNASSSKKQIFMALLAEEQLLPITF